MIKRILQSIKGDRLLKQGLVDTNYYLLAQVGSRVIGLLIIPIFARLLTLEEFATYDLFILASSFIVLLGGLGMDSGAAIKIAENKDDTVALHSLLFTTLFVSLLSIVFLWLVAIGTWYLGFATNDFNPYLIHGLFIYTILYQFNYLVYNFIRWLGNAKIAALINFTSYILGIVGGLVCMLIWKSTLANYILGAIVGSTAGVLLSAYYARSYLALRFLPADHFKDLLRLSLPYVPTYLSSYFMQFVDRLLITSFFGLSTLGLYALVNRIGQVVTFTLQIISSGFRPIITVNYATEEGQGLSRKIFTGYWLATVPVSIISVLMSPLIINIFGGDKYQMAIPVLPYIILSVWLLGSFFLFGFGYQIKRKTIYVTLITFMVVVLIYVLSLVFIRTSGMIGIAQATTLAAALGAFLYVYISERLYSFKYSMKLMMLSIFISILILVLFDRWQS